MHTCAWLVQVGAWGCSAQVWRLLLLLGEWSLPRRDGRRGDIVAGIWTATFGVGREVCVMAMGPKVGGELAGAG